MGRDKENIMSNKEHKGSDQQLKDEAKIILIKALMSANQAKIDVLIPVVTKILGEEYTNQIIKEIKQNKGKANDK